MRGCKFKRFVCFVLAVIMAASFAPMVMATSIATEAPRYAYVNTREEKIDEILRIINRYSPTLQWLFEFEMTADARTAHSIVSGEPGSGYTGIHDRLNDTRNVFGALSHIAHYRAHRHHGYGVSSGYRNRDDTGNRLRHFVDGGSLYVDFVGSEQIRAYNALRLLPDEHRQSAWRVYVGPDSRVPSNIHGAFGLLMEMEAYYIDAIVLYETLPYLLGFMDRNDEAKYLIQGLFRSWNSSRLMFYQLTFWILEYMLYLQANHPDQYRTTMENENFRRAFSYIHRGGVNLHEVILPQVQAQVLPILRERDDVWVNDLGVWVTRSGSSSPVFLFEDHPGTTMYAYRRLREEPRLARMLNELLVDSTPGTTRPPVANPTETPSSWAQESYERAGNYGILPDYFRTGLRTATTRAGFAELAVTLYEHVRRPIAGRRTFTDTNNSFVERAGYIGIVHGVGDGRFSPGAALTRQEAAVMIARLADLLGQPLPSSPSTFADNSQVSDWAIDSVGQMQASGIMGGVGNNQFAPLNSYTREMSVVTMMRLFDLLD